MRLNTLSDKNSGRRAAKRVGRGMSSGHGKTCGRGHKGQRSRSGRAATVGFEGGQMPLQRRLPKFGFQSRTAPRKDEVRSGQIVRVEGDTVDLVSLKAAKLIRGSARQVKIIAAGEVTRALAIRGVALSKGARALVETAGGKVEA